MTRSELLNVHSLDYYIQNKFLLLEWTAYYPNLNSKEMFEQI